MDTFSNPILPPTIQQLETMGEAVVAKLPPVFAPLLKDMAVALAEFPDDGVVEKLGLDSAYELLAFHQTKTLTVYRRPLLDLWCESGRDLTVLLREVIISELGQALSLSDEDIESLVD